jgi:hypothetical protein
MGSPLASLVVEHRGLRSQEGSCIQQQQQSWNAKVGQYWNKTIHNENIDCVERWCRLLDTMWSRKAQIGARQQEEGGRCIHFTLIGLLLECILGNGLEGLLDIDGFLGRSLKERNVALGLAPSHGTLVGDDTLVLEIDLVTENNEWEVLRIAGTGLDEELIAPAVEVLKGLGDVDVENEHAAIGTTVESNTKALEALLTSSIPDLRTDAT